MLTKLNDIVEHTTEKRAESWVLISKVEIARERVDNDSTLKKGDNLVVYEKGLPV